jgi:glycerol-3-phosphate dehydrogenase
MERFDLLIVGGGINGAAIARDAAGRGASVLLVEKDDLAAHTSSASSKLIHGGLRYLERMELRLVREGLREREILLRTAPAIVRPLRFILPHAPGMRPWWMVRAGLRLYDLLARGSSLPRSAMLGEDEARAPLKRGKALRLLSYWDAAVDDSRLVVLNAVDAARHGAQIATRTEFLSARRECGEWRLSLSGGREVAAGAIVDAAGPWVGEVLGGDRRQVRLVRGTHIVVPRLWEGPHAYILQQPDRRVVFAIPYEQDFTLIGTTDVPVDSPGDSGASGEEVAYLCAAASRWFERPVTPDRIVWRYAGVRALWDDGRRAAQAVSRDYRMELDGDGPPLLSVFGGKITTARALAEKACAILRLPGRAWTADSPLPDRPAPTALDEETIRDLVANEFARTPEDILWRRTKCGLHMGEAERQSVSAAIEAWIARF